MRTPLLLVTLVGLSALLLVANASCTSASTAPEPQITGSWSGVLGGGTVTLTIQQAATGLTGFGALTAVGTSLAVVLTGTYTEPIVSLEIRPPIVFLNSPAPGVVHAYEPDRPLNFTGTLDQDRIVGTVNGGTGYSNAPLTLQRQ